MFEAVLPPAEEINAYTPSPTPPALIEAKKNFDDKNEDVKDVQRATKRTDLVSQNESRKLREIHTDSEDGYYEGNERDIENDDHKEIIETTVELHHVPREHAEELEKENFLETADSQETSEPIPMEGIIATTSSTLPIKRLSKSESFSHNSEFNEANLRRKNFKSARSNAMMNRSSQSSSGSAMDLRRSMSLSDSEEELEELRPVINRKPEARNNASKGALQANNDKTLSMSDLSTGKSEKKNNEAHSAELMLLKATSLQKLSGGESPKESGGLETYKKQLEIQFEQWKEDFMKQHGGKENNELILEEVSYIFTV